MSTLYLFKKAAERVLEEEAIYRPKRGSTVPILTWIKRGRAVISYELFLGKRALGRQKLKTKILKCIMSEHQCGRRDYGYLIWTLMVLELC